MNATAPTPNLVYELRPHWPKLAWVAHVPRDGGPVIVERGPGVEARPQWFGDAVWNGPVQEGRLDQADVVFGSGARVDDDGITFVSSSATVDRLQWFEDGNGAWVSNTLAGLIHRLGARLDPLCDRYPAWFESVIHGLDRHQRSLPTSLGPIQLAYFHNLRWQDGRLRPMQKPRIERSIADFAGYHGFLAQTIQQLAENAGNPGRCFPLRLLGTVSRGFDSPAAVALAQPAGLDEAFTVNRARDGEDDSGVELGERLGLKVHAVARDAWRDRTNVEPPFLASDAKGEDVYFASASEHLTGRLVLTGFAAGPWKRGSAPNLDLRRADQSGLSLTEYRLHAGFVHVPVPTIGAQYGEAIHRMMHTPEMDRWVSGRAYDKPFCRRVLIEAGVPEAMFGQTNRAASVLFFDRRSFLSEQSRHDYEHHLGAARRERPARAWLKRLRDAAERGVSAVVGAGQAGAAGAYRLTRWPGFDRAAKSWRLRVRAGYETRYRYLFPWAVEKLRTCYAASDEEGKASRNE